MSLSSLTAGARLRSRPRPRGCEEAPGVAWAPAGGRRRHADPGAAQGRPPTREARQRRAGRAGFAPASRTRSPKCTGRTLLPRPSRDDPTQDDLQAGPVFVLHSHAGAPTAWFLAQEPLLPTHRRHRSRRQTLGRCWALLPTHPHGEGCSVTPGSQRKSQFF